MVVVIHYFKAAYRSGEVHDYDKGVTDVLGGLLQGSREKAWFVHVAPSFLCFEIDGKLPGV